MFFTVIRTAQLALMALALGTMFWQEVQSVMASWLRHQRQPLMTEAAAAAVAVLLLMRMLCSPT